MEREICDYYEPIRRLDKLCKHFIGDRENRKQVDRCRYNCSIMESKRLMEDVDSYKRIHGAIRRR